MIIFHCIPTKEPITPDSPFFADNIKPIDIDAEMTYLTNTEDPCKPFTDLCRIALHKMYFGLSFDKETRTVKNKFNGKTCKLTDLDSDIRAVLAVTSWVAYPYDPVNPPTSAELLHSFWEPRAERYLAFPEELHSRRALRTLQALPLEIHFAISYDEYQGLAYEIVDAEEEYIEEMERCDASHEELDELLRNYGFTVIVDGVTYLVGQPHAGPCVRLTGLGTDDFAEADEE